ncbi:MAG: hypothetical protein COA79_13900 [Planctomycetota bacterium]|nr:MAG: hypothetical protein COA79_13900 [Planctomycetota bacterium]
MIHEISNRLKSLATLDAIVCPDWEFRYFSYNSQWSEGEEMGSLRDGSGGQWFFWKKGELAGYKCISPEDGVVEYISDHFKDIPSSYNSFINEPAFSMLDSSCVWYLMDNNWIKLGVDIKHVLTLEKVISWEPINYKEWAEEYYEENLDLEAISHIFTGNINVSHITSLNPDVEMSELTTELEEIGMAL